jgi:hypothetical protein
MGPRAAADADLPAARVPATRRQKFEPDVPRRQIMNATSTLQSAIPSTPSAEAPVSSPPQPAVDLHAQIAERAYLRAQLRGFAPGLELDDWLAAEAELAAGASAPDSAVPA